MSTASATKFERVVRERLIENKLAGLKPDSIRGLARLMADGDPARAETFKRSLFKWMAVGEPHPTRASRAHVAAALGVDPSELSDDDEEADPVGFGDVIQKMFDRAVDAAVERKFAATRGEAPSAPNQSRVLAGHDRKGDL